MTKIKKAQTGTKFESKSSRDVTRMPGGSYKVVTKSKTTPSGIERESKAVRTIKGVLKGEPKIKEKFKSKTPYAKFDIPAPEAKSGKKMLKRKDGSVSQQGLWDNIRNAAKKNKAAGKPGKKPTAAMLKQERKIKAKSK